MLQQTLSCSVSISGVGLHTGKPINMILRPAEENTGIAFVRSDILDEPNHIPVRWDHVIDTQLCTVVGLNARVRVGTIEHLMSALRGCGVDNALIEIDGPEVPAMDGSAMPFVQLIQEVGLAEQCAPRKIIKILKPFRVEDGDKWASLAPDPFSTFSGEISFPHKNIGIQRFTTTLLNGNFVHDIAQARTFGFLHEVEYMRSVGLALGGSLENAVVLNEQGVMNTDGLRFHNEFVRHKLLDAIGDLYLAGAAIQGHYDSFKAGHALNNQLLHALFAQPDCWTYVCDSDIGGDQNESTSFDSLPNIHHQTSLASS